MKDRAKQAVGHPAAVCTPVTGPSLHLTCKCSCWLWTVDFALSLIIGCQQWTSFIERRISELPHRAIGIVIMAIPCPGSPGSQNVHEFPFPENVLYILYTIPTMYYPARFRSIDKVRGKYKDSICSVADIDRDKKRRHNRLQTIKLQ